MHDTATATAQEDRPVWGRGVLASSGLVTPSRRIDDVAKFKISLRDAILVLLGCVGMYGAQVARDYGLRSDMRDLQTSFEASVRSQQQQIDQWRQETKLNNVNITNVQTELAKLQGILLGAGIKGVQK